ncbi:MAG: hypothetical protein RBU30_17120 [Polyangia bacterium]|jgi:hypothetical protein|nr:hypothetical protein [Polyangia bacterium]
MKTALQKTIARCFGFGLTALMLVFTLACLDRPMKNAQPEPNYFIDIDLPQSLERDVDLLFVIDDSGSMLDEQILLQAQFSALMQKLRAMEGGLPNVHLGVTSTDLGTSPFPITFCEQAGGDGGRLLTGSCVNPTGAPYVVDVEPQACEISKDELGICSAHGCQEANCAHEPSTSLAIDAATGCPRCRNYQGQDLEDVFSCIAGLGTQGCGFEQPLEAMYKALDSASTANSGFVRENAFLAVVFITDEDDCSASNPQLYDNSQTDINSQLGPLTSFRCFEFGIQCDQTGRTLQGLRTNCQPREDAGALLHPVSRYVNFLQQMKDPQMLVVAAIAGPVTNQQVTVGLDEYSQPEVAFSCSTERGGAVPGVRLRALVDAFNQPEDLSWAFSSICSATYTDALQGVADKIIGGLAPQCPPTPFKGCSDPGAQFGLPADGYAGNDQCLPTCRLQDVFQRGTAEESRADLPPCLEVCPQGSCQGNQDPALAYASGHPAKRDSSLPVEACWHINYQERCVSSNFGEIQVSRRADPPPRSFTDMVCVLVPQTELLCTDGRDNDEDGLTDWDDPDCASP